MELRTEQSRSRKELDRCSCIGVSPQALSLYWKPAADL